MSHWSCAQAAHPSGRRTTPATRSPAANPEPSGADRTRPSDSCPSTSCFAPAGGRPYPAVAISTSVPHTPISRPSTSTDPSLSGGSGRSSTVAVVGEPGTTVSARMATSSPQPARLPSYDVSGPSSPRSALLAAWGNAWLTGEVSLPDLVERVTSADDLHTVTNLWVDDLPLEQAMGRLRADGVSRLRVVLPAPGDVVGLPGPGPFTAAAIDASEGVLALRDDGTGSGLVPAVTAHGSEYDGTVTTVMWSAHPVEVRGADPGPFLHDAEH